MSRLRQRARAALSRQPLAILIAAFVLSGCASTAVQENFAAVQDVTQSSIGAEVRWLTSDAARREAAERVDALLAAPLGADDAVRVALSYSPAVQALLFDAAGRSAESTQAARLPNPVFAFERLVRVESGVRELEIGRVLAFSLYDLVLLPARLDIDKAQQAQLRLRAAAEIVRSASDVRQGWLRAVAASQALAYHEQVKGAADASAELARRMQAAGNFSKLQRAREQAFAAQSVVELARARQAATSAREALVRLLGLSPAQAARLTLPDRLPDLPPAPKDDTPAMRGYSCSTPSTLSCGRRHSARSCCTTNGVPAKSMFGFGTAACRLGTSCPCFICNSTLVSAAMPAALSAWPMFDLTEPIAQKCLSGVYRANACVSPAISIGSPSCVPVPCASM